MSFRVIRARIFISVSLFATLFAGNAHAANERVAGLLKPQTGRYMTIGNNSGGQVIQFGLQMLKWKRAGHKIRFSGRCASACTLYLGLSPKNVCISPGASFHFHAPYGANKAGNRLARSYMMRNYPGWVKAWINRNGGLGQRVIAMNYGYAARYIRPCNTQTVQAD